ncbi:MAG: calcium-binding protein, partial [Actinomycetota bacterium]
MRRLLTLVLALTLAVPTGGSSAGQERRAECFGRRADVVGSGRAERIIGTPRADVIHAGGGRDEIFGLGGNDVICGGKGRDDLYGGEGHDRLAGGRGGDFLAGVEGNDRLVGGRGGDLAQYLGHDRAVRVNLQKGKAKGWGNDRLRGVEHLGGTDYADVFVGDARRNLLFGHGGDDRLYGADGRDFLFPGPGDDVLGGGDGFDAADYTLSESAVV